MTVRSYNSVNLQNPMAEHKNYKNLAGVKYYW